jgi:hypothetical protein
MKPLMFVLIILLLAACAPKTQAITEPQTRVLEQGETLFINTALNLRTFPRSVIYQMDEDKNKTTYAFFTPLMISTVFDSYHSQLISSGWRQETIRKRDNDYEALYSKQGGRLTVRLRLEGDRYIFETR